MNYLEELHYQEVLRNSFISDMDWCTLDWTKTELSDLFEGVEVAYQNIEQLKEMHDYYDDAFVHCDVNLSSLIQDLVYNGFTKEEIINRSNMCYGGIYYFYLTTDEMYCMIIE